MSLAEVCDKIGNIDSSTTLDDLALVSTACEEHLGSVEEILDAVENNLATSVGSKKLLLWYFIDRLAKQHSLFLDSLRPKILSWLTRYSFKKEDSEWNDFVQLLSVSFSLLFGSPLVSLAMIELDPQSTEHSASSSNKKRTGTALATHRTSLRSVGSFATKMVSFRREDKNKSGLQVKTLDSQMAMNVASSYAPVCPVELKVQELRPDSDAPRGYMKALPSDYTKKYEDLRKKRLREVMESNRAKEDEKQRELLLKRIRGENESTQQNSVPDFSDVVMPIDLPRDEHGVKRANFPLGVRFIRNAIRACGGAIELDVIVHRISTLASKEIVAEFGDVREFLFIHKPTFRLENEKNKWIVRLAEDRNKPMDSTWESIQCPLCSLVLKGRNLARHTNCRRCVTGQISLGLQGTITGPISELIVYAKNIISQPHAFDDWDVECLTEALRAASEVRRFRLASPRNFVPVMKAIRIIRDRWLRQKGVKEVQDVLIEPSDTTKIHLFRSLGQRVNRLPIPWIEMGDVVDLCSRFTDGTLPPFNPPPRPADPRISLQSEYPGFLLCESEVDDEDDPSDNEEEFSDDEAPAFTFAPPVSLAESIFTAGFDRDMKRLQHRMRTAPPLVLQRVLQGDRNQTQSEMYSSIHAPRRAR